MSFINLLGLSDAGYGNIAKGILYVIYELLWKIIYGMGKLIDSITGLFYKIAGLDYLGSGGETLVEEQDLLTQMFNQNIVSKISIFMILASILLMAVFGGVAVLKRLYFTKENPKSMVDIIKNMVLGSIFLIVLTPLALFAISFISTMTSAIAGLFGSEMNVSITDAIFNASFSARPVDAYNSIYSVSNPEWVNITSWTEMKNSDFLFELVYGNVVETEFYWYLCLLGGGVVLYNVVVLAIKLVKRIFNVIILYLLAPIYVAKMVDDGGVKFKELKNKAMAELVSIVGSVVGFMVLLSLVSMINNLELIKVSSPESSEGLPGMIEPVIDEVNPVAALINSLTRIILLVAGTSVAKDSGDLLGDLFRDPNNETATILENIYDRLSNRETKAATANIITPKTRVITKNTTTTRRIVDFSEDVPLTNSNKAKQSVNMVSNQKNNFNTVVNNYDNKTTNLQNRTNVSMDSAKLNEGVKVGKYKGNSESNVNKSPMDILDQAFSSYKVEADSLRNEWAFVKNGNSSESKQVVKEFEAASNDLDTSIALGEQNKIKESMNKYVDAYRHEEKVAKEGYKDFAGKSAKLSEDLTMKQQEELKKISSAYRKAQIDYSKTARKLSEVSVGNMSASEALRVKERADKQREKLMEASSKANDFYNNQKKGV